MKLFARLRVTLGLTEMVPIRMEMVPIIVIAFWLILLAMVALEEHDQWLVMRFKAPAPVPEWGIPEMVRLVRSAADEPSAPSRDAVISKTIDGIITSWDNGAERLFGYKACEIIGQPITRIIPSGLVTEETWILDTLRHNQRIHAKDGRHIKLSLTIMPVCDDTGRVVAASKFAHSL